MTDSHPRYDLCHDTSCQRYGCVAYREGYGDGERDGLDDGRRQGYAEGHADGLDDCARTHKEK